MLVRALHKLSFGQRIFLALVLLLATLQVITTLVVYSAARASVERTAGDELQTGLRVFFNDYQMRQHYLLGAVQTIAQDWAFRNAVGSGDKATAISVLNNHRRRINAAIGVYISADQNLIANTAELPVAAQNRLRAAALDGGDNKIILPLGDTLYQFHFSAVKAPVTIGWVAMGFAIDNQLAATFGDTNQLGISFVRRLGHNNSLAASNLGDIERQQLIHWLSSDPLPKASEQRQITSPSADSRTLQAARLLQPFGNENLYVLLQKNIDQPLAQFNSWWLRLQWLFAALLLAAAAIAALVSRSISRPLQRLINMLQRVSSGDYQARIEFAGGAEIDTLVEEFHKMQTAVAEREQEIRFRAEHDPLTGLLGRDKFIRELDQLIDAQRSKLLAVMVFNLNGFRDINDTLSHDIGDQLLKQLAQRLQQKFPNQLLTRHGADQFALCCAVTDFSELKTLSRQLNQLFEADFDACGIAIALNATQGLALYPEHGQQALSLLRVAEVAMYTAKEQGLVCSIYDPRQDKHSVQRLTLMSDLPRAISDNQLQLYFQPTLDLSGPAPVVAKVECLTRWQHPELGLIPPDDFIALAEQSGAIVELTLWAIDRALNQCLIWRQAQQYINVAVNISAVDLFSGNLTEQVPAMLQHYQLPGQCLTLEITESEIMKDPEHAQRELHKLRRHGVRLSIDDYGTGYSSLAQMKQLPADELKIDKSFVMELMRSPADQAIVRSTIELGHTMGLKIVAEGVEQGDTLEFLTREGCDYGQGYYIAKPLPLDELQLWLETTPFEVSKIKLQQVK